MAALEIDQDGVIHISGVRVILAETDSTIESFIPVQGSINGPIIGTAYLESKEGAIAFFKLSIKHSVSSLDYSPLPRYAQADPHKPNAYRKVDAIVLYGPSTTYNATLEEQTRSGQIE